ncbi:MAG: response regulator transcription factor [Acetobacteraceae bacterium]|nr:response regulator transcription factor [Acetobacteraceae bacterium]
MGTLPRDLLWGPAMAKVLIADDHPLFRDALKSVVSRLFGERGQDFLCREAGTHDEVFGVAGAEPDLDLILLDLFMPGADGLSELAALRNAVPAVPIVIISLLEDPATVRQAMVCGAAGYIPKTSSKELIAAALQTVLAGGIYVPGELLVHMQPAAPVAHCAEEESGPLTPRQVAVLSLLARGKANKEIARELRISEMTVKAHMTAVMRKLRVSTRAQAIVAFRRGHP